MAQIEDGIIDRLLADSAVSGVVGYRVYPVRVDQRYEPPAVVIQRTGTTRFPHHGGSSGKVTARLQITSISDTTYSAAKDLADKVRLSLYGFRGLLTAGGTMVSGIHIEDELDAPENPAAGDSRGPYAVQQICVVKHSETVPSS